jgi:hypothetical protein
MAKLSARPSCIHYKLVATGTGVGALWTPTKISEALNHNEFATVSGDYISVNPGEYYVEFGIYAGITNSVSTVLISLEIDGAINNNITSNIYGRSNHATDSTSTGMAAISLKSTTNLSLKTATLTAGTLSVPDVNMSYLLLWRIQ